MSALIDEISRVIASPISRRQAFKLVSRAVGGAVLASLGYERDVRGQESQASVCAQFNQVPCDMTCCYSDELCCGGTCYGASVKASYFCCATFLCRRVGEQCCTDHCCPTTHTCCGLKCCGRDQVCCNGTCCAPRAVCCGNTCCPEGYFCCANKCVRSRPSTSEPCIAV